MLDALHFLSRAVNGLDRALELEGGLARLHTQGASGPVELELEVDLDFGRKTPLVAVYAMALDDLFGRTVVESERLTTQSSDGAPREHLDARRGHARLLRTDGERDEALVGASTLVLSALGERDQERYPLATDLREALGHVVLVERDPVALPELAKAPFGFSGKVRAPWQSSDLLRQVADDPDLVERLAAHLRQFFPRLREVRRLVQTGEPVGIEVVEEGGVALTLDELSAGMRQILLLLSIYLAPRAPTLVLLEEPDAGVHPGVHPALVDLLRSLGRRCPVVLTSHSPSFIGLLDPEREVVALERSSDGVKARPLAEALSSHGWLKSFGPGAEAFVHLAAERKP